MSRSGAALVASHGLRIRQVKLRSREAGLDPRVDAFRSDLADIRLAGRVAAAHYAEPVALRCQIQSATMRARPSGGATAVSELLYGEDFTAFEIAGAWAWGSCSADGYVGYVDTAALTAPGSAPTHRVSAVAAIVFADADIKSPQIMTLPLNARIVARTDATGFIELETGGFVHPRHVAPLTIDRADPVAVAHDLLGTPYLWGGRTRAGIDCSGLVQAALHACGHVCPRDTDQQRDAIGRAADLSDLRRGDIVFFPGHVGLMASTTNLLHANAHWMATVVEPLADVVDRLRPDHPQPVLAVRRL